MQKTTISKRIIKVFSEYQYPADQLLSQAVDIIEISKGLKGKKVPKSMTKDFQKAVSSLGAVLFTLKEIAKDIKG